MGKAVAAVVLPGQIGSFSDGRRDDAMGSSHVVSVDWAYGKRSMIKLSDGMFKHFTKGELRGPEAPAQVWEVL